MTTKNLKAANIFTTFVDDVDRLGLLQSQIADLTREADEIKALLKVRGKGVFEGNLFRAVVVEQERVTFDNDILKTVVPFEILEFARRENLVTTVRVTGRKA
jgi:hypothetical protein